MIKRYFQLQKLVWIDSGIIPLFCSLILPALFLIFINPRLPRSSVFYLGSAPVSFLYFLLFLIVIITLIGPFFGTYSYKITEDLDIKTLSPNEDGIDVELFVQDGSEVYPFNEFTSKFLTKETKVLVKATLEGVTKTKTYLLSPEDIIKVSKGSFDLVEVQTFKREITNSTP